MPAFFHPPEDDGGILPFEGFPLTFSQGTLSAVVSTDNLSSTLFITSSLASALRLGKAYHIGPGRSASPVLIRRFGSNVENFLVGNVYSGKELVEALGYVDEGSFVLVSRFPLLAGTNPEVILEVRRIADEHSLRVVLHHEAMIFNELDIPGEFSRLFKLPELFDSLLVLRTSSYRGHYRMNITVLKAPPESVSSVGEHSIPVTELVRLITNRDSREFPQHSERQASS